MIIPAQEVFLPTFFPQPEHGKCILVVEDDKASAMLMAYKLKGSGYTVVFAPDGCEAISQIRSENPDLMILDLALPSRNPFAGPQWDGFSLMDWLSRSRPTEPIPIVVVTATPYAAASALDC